MSEYVLLTTRQVRFRVVFLRYPPWRIVMHDPEPAARFAPLAG
jgi:hypothetical protein